MSNLAFTYIFNIWFANSFCRYTQLNDQTVLFLMIQFYISQQSQMVPSIAMHHQQFIKHWSFVYTQLNDQIVLFQTIQLNVTYLFALSLNVK